MALAKKRNLDTCKNAHNVDTRRNGMHQTPGALPAYKSKYHARLANARKILAEYGNIDLLGALWEMRREDASKE